MKQILNQLHTNQCVVMGILNATPDSFSDGGVYNQLDDAVARACQMQADGADIIDIGGESTRPGAKAISTALEISRVIPVIQAIRKNSAIPVSIDTTKPEVMRAAVEAGADMVNDVSALQAKDAIQTCVELDVPVCLMHKQGKPETMQQHPVYQQVVVEVKAFLLERVARCRQAGIAQQHIILDPGFGFGKRLEDNLQLLARIDELVETGYPILVGVSRKSMFGMLLDLPVDQRMTSSVAAAVLAYTRGARFFRVHDVKQTVDALKLCQALTQIDKP